MARVYVVNGTLIQETGERVYVADSILVQETTSAGAPATRKKPRHSYWII